MRFVVTLPTLLLRDLGRMPQANIGAVLWYWSGLGAQTFEEERAHGPCLAVPASDGVSLIGAALAGVLFRSCYLPAPNFSMNRFEVRGKRGVRPRRPAAPI